MKVVKDSIISKVNVYNNENISLRVLQNKIQSSIIVFADIELALMGHRQTVRHWTLTPASQGSNPCGPVNEVEREYVL